MLVTGTPSFLGLGPGRTAGSARGAARVCGDTMADPEAGSIELTATSSGRVGVATPTARRSPPCSSADGCEHVLAVELQLAGTDPRQGRQLHEVRRTGLGDRL